MSERPVSVVKSAMRKNNAPSSKAGVLTLKESTWASTVGPASLVVINGMSGSAATSWVNDTSASPNARSTSGGVATRSPDPGSDTSAVCYQHPDRLFENSARRGNPPRQHAVSCCERTARQPLGYCASGPADVAVGAAAKRVSSRVHNTAAHIRIGLLCETLRPADRAGASARSRSLVRKSIGVRCGEAQIRPARCQYAGYR